MICAFVISTVRRPIGRPEGHKVAFNLKLHHKVSCGGMKVVFTPSNSSGQALSGAEWARNEYTPLAVHPSLALEHCVAASKPQALGMVANARVRLNTHFAGMTAQIGLFE